jgi:hypothetical protein
MSGSVCSAAVLAQQEGAVAAARSAGAAGELRAVAFLTTRSRWAVTEAGLAAAAYVVLCVVVLRACLPEPDDIAYRASIVAMTHGTSSPCRSAGTSVAQQVAPGRISSNWGGPIQWGAARWRKWVSEKDPGYPYRRGVPDARGYPATPLFFAALACLGLYFGARLARHVRRGRCYLLRRGDRVAWRDYMPTFTDAADRSGHRSVAVGVAAPRRPKRRTGLGWRALSRWRPLRPSGTPTS